MKKLASLYPSATRRKGTSIQNAWFSQNSLILLLETGKWRGGSQYCLLVIQHSHVLCQRVTEGL